MTDFEKVYNFENLYRAYRKARRGKRWKGAAAKFEVNLLEALNLLSVQLQSHTYRLSPYNTFKVYEPKERVVMSNSYKDKVVQHALCDNVLEPRVQSTFIKDNYASQVGKGTHFGLERLEGFMRRFYRVRGVDGWVLKCDISKYFYNIKHDALKSLIRKQSSQLFRPSLSFFAGSHDKREVRHKILWPIYGRFLFDPRRQRIFALLLEGD